MQNRLRKPHSTYLVYEIFLLIIFILTQSCTQRTNPNARISDLGHETGLTVYFTEPYAPESETLRGGPDQKLAEAIYHAQTSVDIAAQYLDLWSIRDALIDTYQRGIPVRMVVESNFLHEKEIKDLMDAGIPILGDRREGLMHNKFVIIDRKQVWTGSMNFSMNGAYRNDNHIICIHSSSVAEIYTQEFEEMFIHDQFGPTSPRNSTINLFSIGNSDIEVFFSPEDDTIDHIIERITSAKESIYLLAFSFTSDEIAEAIIERAHANVKIAGVFEKSQYHSNIGTQFNNLIAEGLDFRLDSNPNSMHHKVIIIDQQIVVTGSYNFSYNAENNNDENTIIINDPQISSQFVDEFERIFLQSIEIDQSLD